MEKKENECFSDEICQRAVDFMTENSYWGLKASGLAGTMRGFSKKSVLNISEIVQIFSEIGGVIPDSENPYILLADYIQKTHPLGLGCNITDIGGGSYPAFGKIVDSRQQQLKKGSMTVYDSTLVRNDIGNMKLFRTYFGETTSLENTDIMTLNSPYPRDTTELAIGRSIEENKDLYVVFWNYNSGIEETMYFAYDYLTANCNRDDVVLLEYLDDGRYLRKPVLSKVKNGKQLTYKRDNKYLH